MPNDLCLFPELPPPPISSAPFDQGHTFEQILQRLHVEGIYVHPDQLAEFLLVHGLPVQLRYVPARLRSKAKTINQNYRGDMANLVEED